MQRSEPARSFASRLAADNISLALVLGCLDVCSTLRCRRVSRLWHAASLKPEAWLHASLTLGLEQLLCVPPTSLVALQRLRLVRETRPGMCDVDPTCLIQRLSRMPRLRALCLQNIEVTTKLCQLLAEHAPRLRELDLTTCSYVT